MAFQVMTADTGLRSRNLPEESVGLRLRVLLCHPGSARPLWQVVFPEASMSCLFPPSHSLEAQLQIECNSLGMWTFNAHGDTYSDCLGPMVGSGAPRRLWARSSMTACTGDV